MTLFGNLSTWALLIIGWIGIGLLISLAFGRWARGGKDGGK